LIPLGPVVGTGAIPATLCSWLSREDRQGRGIVHLLLEKLIPIGRWIARAAGVVCVVAGAWMFISMLQ